MLALKRKPGQEIEIAIPGVANSKIIVRIADIDKNQVTLGITAAPAYKILRRELAIRDRNKAALNGECK